MGIYYCLWTAAFLIFGAEQAQSASVEGLQPWASNTHPTDVARRHIEEITTGPHEYVVIQGGTMDGQNCRSPVGVYEAWWQTWESNRAVRMENVGETDVINPWLSNGRNNFRTIGEIVAAAMEPGMSDKEKAIALWYQETRHRYHFGTEDNEVINPVKVFNVYGYNTCGNDSICLAGLWHRAGLEVSPARLMGHCISQVFYDGRWHLMDGDMHSIYLLRDNETIASEYDLARDHDLIKRSHVHGILFPDTRATSEWEAALYIYEGEAKGDRDCQDGHTMNMVLRPGESLTWRWGHLSPVKYHGKSPVKYPDTISNGLWEYRPDFTRDIWRKGADTVENIKTTSDGLVAETGETGVIVWTMRSPYVFVGGSLEIEGSGAEFALSWDGETWQEVRGNLDSLFPPAGEARYQYYLRCQLSGDARIKRLGIVNDLQMTPLLLPEMMVGENNFVYTDQSAGGQKVRITHEWVERSASAPPEPPPAPVFPADGSEINGTDITFQWSPPPGLNEVADYHFELSDRSDMRWPLSTNFAKLISNINPGEAQYTLPYDGLLTPDREYYWRVRAKNTEGVWGQWGKTWSFTLRGSAAPVDVTMEYDPDRGIGTLRWKPNPVGRRPVSFRVYGSDEKGFTISDEPYEVNVGDQEDKLPTPFPANFVTETPQTELAVVGAGLELPNANKAFYRVVAVDAQGKRSWSSDYAVAPRPFIYSEPVVTAEVGAEYRYQVSTIRSLGHLTARAPLAMSFWDIEEPVFSLEQAPEWLKIDASTGLLSGKPDTVGEVKVVVTVTIDKEVRKLDEYTLSWGREKIIATITERIGSATQEFVIRVLLPKGGLSE